MVLLDFWVYNLGWTEEGLDACRSHMEGEGSKRRKGSAMLNRGPSATFLVYTDTSGRDSAQESSKSLVPLPLYLLGNSILLVSAIFIIIAILLLLLLLIIIIVLDLLSILQAILQSIIILEE